MDYISTSIKLTKIESSVNLKPTLVSVFKIPFEMEGTIYYWLWDNGDFILWDNGDRMRQ